MKIYGVFKVMDEGANLLVKLYLNMEDAELFTRYDNTYYVESMWAY